METLLLTFEQAGKALNLSAMTVRRMVGTGQLSHYKIGRASRVSAEEIRQLVETSRVADGDLP